MSPRPFNPSKPKALESEGHRVLVSLLVSLWKSSLSYSLFTMYSSLVEFVYKTFEVPVP